MCLYSNREKLGPALLDSYLSDLQQVSPVTGGKQIHKQRALFLLVLGPLVTVPEAPVRPFRVTELELDCPTGTDCPSSRHSLTDILLKVDASFDF